MMVAGNQADAVLLYKQIANDKDPILAAIARIHAGWAIVDSAPRSEVEGLVAPLTDSTNPWHSMAREVLAYADYRSGAIQAALHEYQALVNDPNAPSQLRVRCDVMATFIKAGGDKDYGTVPPPPTPQSALPTGPHAPAGGHPQK